jgi:hypothetical protein
MRLANANKFHRKSGERSRGMTKGGAAVPCSVVTDVSLLLWVGEIVRGKRGMRGKSLRRLRERGIAEGLCNSYGIREHTSTVVQFWRPVD